MHKTLTVRSNGPQGVALRLNTEQTSGIFRLDNISAGSKMVPLDNLVRRCHAYS